MATILIVDDLPANRDVLVTLLRYQGHRLLEAANGAAGLAVAKAEHPDVVVTDVLMPVMDGFELVRQLRLDPDTSRIPIIFYTAHYGEREARELALSNGVAYVLTKPVEPENVLATVASALAGGVEPGMSDRGSRAVDFDYEHLRLVTNKLSETREDLQNANARLRALINIGLELASERNAEQLLQNVCLAARELFGASYVTLGILDRHDRTVRYVATAGVDAGDVTKIGDTVHGMLSTVIMERRAFRGTNPDGNPANVQLPASHPTVHAFLIAPIGSPTHVYGWICLVGNEGATFSEDDEQLVMALSGQVGRIYENGHFYALAREERDRAQGYLERMQFALQSANVGIWEMDYSTGRLRWSETIEAHYGLQPGTFGGTFQAFIERVHPDDRAALLDTVGRAMKSGADFVVQNRAVWPDGTVRWLTGAGRIFLDERREPLRGIGISEDITERHSLEQQYHQAQKMEAVGRLAGGVAHDFNNLLTAILGYCELLLAHREAEDPDYTDITEIQKAGLRASGLTRQLLAFSRKQIIEPTLLDLNAIVADMRGMLERIIGEDVTIMLGLHAALAPIVADRGQVEQIVMNLAINARDAMPNGGTLAIDTTNVELDDYYAAAHPGVKSGSYVALTVSDSGVGMSPEVLERIFEPFFTTKPPGKGTGLGLATVHGITARSGGSIGVYSELGKGTSFKVYFPRADSAEIVADQPPAPVRTRAGGETVLVVEDADALRELTKRLLERAGYSVLLAGNADEALHVFEQHHAIDVLLTDVVMPGASGSDLSQLLVERRPALRVVYMSGYTEDAITRHGVLKPGIAFLQKPFSADTLARKIRDVLDR